jgi:hypothetical protein
LRAAPGVVPGAALSLVTSEARDTLAGTPHDAEADDTDSKSFLIARAVFYFS